MKRILIVVDSLIVGGTSSSIISLLRLLPVSEMCITLVYFNAAQSVLNSIPSHVKLVNKGRQDWVSRSIGILKKSVATKLSKALYISSRNNSYMSMVQRVSSKVSERMESIEEFYDIAIAGMEVLSTYYVANKVNASMKIAWIHTNYAAARLNHVIDNSYYECYNTIVTVSNECQVAFNDIFPHYAYKSIVIKNTIDEKHIRELANEKIIDMSPGSGQLCIVTVARLDNKSKRFDRIIGACQYLNQRNVSYKWYIIGDGNDRKFVENGIKKHNLEKNLVLLGEKGNPYPYIRNSSLFVLLSSFEGKPISVTEAQILGCPVIVTDYASAREQVPDTYGRVIANSDESIASELYQTLQDEETLRQWRENLKDFKVDNTTSIQEFLQLVGERDTE